MKLDEFLPESVTINGAEDKAAEYYQKVGHFLFDKLNIPAQTKVIVHIDYNIDPEGNQNGSTLPDLKTSGIVHVYLRPGLDRASLLRAICHEFVHAEQIASGRLRLDIQGEKLKGMYWEGNPVQNTAFNRNSEWELEATIKERTLLQDVIGAVGNLMY